MRRTRVSFYFSCLCWYFCLFLLGLEGFCLVIWFGWGFWGFEEFFGMGGCSSFMWRSRRQRGKSSKLTWLKKPSTTQTGLGCALLAWVAEDTFLLSERVWNAQNKLLQRRKDLKSRWISVFFFKDAVLWEAYIYPFEACSPIIVSSHFLDPPCCVTMWHPVVWWESREILAVWELLFLLMYAKNIIAKCIICCNLHSHIQNRSGQSSHKDAVPFFPLSALLGSKILGILDIIAAQAEQMP